MVSLVWSDFQANLAQSLWEGRSSGELCDVTLVAEDGEAVEAHRAVLAAGSSFFQKVLRSSGQPHPLVFLRGVPRALLEEVVAFLYTGQAASSQDFLTIGHQLGLRGLRGEVAGHGMEETGAEIFLEETFPVSPIKEEITPQKGEKYQRRNTHVCPYCNLTVKQGNLGRHVKSLHKGGDRHPCQECGKYFKRTDGLKRHLCQGWVKRVLLFIFNIIFSGGSTFFQ